MPVKGQNFFDPFVTIAISGPSISTAADVADETGFKKDEQSMTISSRIALGISAAAVSLSLALAPAFAADDMKKDDGMKKDAMSKDGMKKDDGMMKKDDGMKKDGMKKDDGMKK
jgi:pentapeptide MXKDX repeat protein